MWTPIVSLNRTWDCADARLLSTPARGRLARAARACFAPETCPSGFSDQSCQGTAEDEEEGSETTER